MAGDRELRVSRVTNSSKTIIEHITLNKHYGAFVYTFLFSLGGGGTSGTLVLPSAEHIKFVAEALLTLVSANFLQQQHSISRNKLLCAFHEAKVRDDRVAGAVAQNRGGVGPKGRE